MKRLAALLLAALTLSPTFATAQSDAPPVLVRALAVAQTSQGLVGSVAEISIRQTNGTGLVFLDTQPFAQVDMQGSARLAVRVAAAASGLDASERDFYFVIRSPSQIIGGPSAGGVMTIGAIAALQGWTIDPTVYMTGTINPDGSIGPVGGVPEKAQAAAQNGARLFLYPAGLENLTVLTSQGRERLNMSDHCERLNIECRSVTSIDEALPAFTGRSFLRPDIPESSDERYLETMRPLAEAQTREARDALTAATLRRNASVALRNSLLNQVDARLAEAEAAMSEAEAAIQDRAYYTASSRSFLASIHVRYANVALDALDSGDAARSLQDAIAQARPVVDEALSAARGATISSPTQLQAVGAAQQRATEANASLRQAELAYRQGNAALTIQNIAYAVERAGTVAWWLDIASEFGGATAFTLAAQEGDARQAIEDAAQHLTYAEAVLEGAASASVLSEAQASLQTARDEIEAGLPAAAIYQALEAQVQASIAIESLAFGDSIPSSRLERAEAEARRAVAEARGAGNEPVLAASQIEFAGTLDEPSQRAAFLDLARIVARSDKILLDDAGEPTPSVFVATPSRVATDEVGLPIAVAASFGVGVLVTWALMRRRGRRVDAEAPPSAVASAVVLEPPAPAQPSVEGTRRPQDEPPIPVPGPPAPAPVVEETPQAEHEPPSQR